MLTTTKEMEIKSTMRYLSPSIRITIIKMSSVDEDVVRK